MNKKETAQQYFKDGYNCCQAVLLAFEKEMGVDKNTILKMSAAMGGGLARMRETCGAVSAIGIAAGLLTEKNSEIKDAAAKEKLYKQTQKACRAFAQETGSLNCGILLGLTKGVPDNAKPAARTEEYYKKRPCAELCALSAELIEKVFLNKEEGTHE